MTIDILSLIIGVLMWEFVRGYFTGFVIPSIKQMRKHDKKENKSNTKTDKKPVITKEAEA